MYTYIYISQTIVMKESTITKTPSFCVSGCNLSEFLETKMFYYKVFEVKIPLLLSSLTYHET